MLGAELVEVGPVLATPTDLLRLATVPVFVWAALRDVQTRRIASILWTPLTALGIVLLAIDLRAAFATSGAAGDVALVWTAIGIAWLVSIALAMHYVGGFGGADARALMTIAVLFPLYPEFYVGTLQLPIERSTQVFSFAILVNAVVWGTLYPVLLAGGNALRGYVGRAMFVGLPKPTAALDRTHGKLLDRREHAGVLDRIYTAFVPRRRGLDLDALRMYLRWRGLSLAEFLAEPAAYRDPATLPAEPNPPTDGAVRVGEERGAAASDGGPVDADVEADAEPGEDGRSDVDDPWGAAAFLADIEGDAYGTTPETLRHGLAVIAERDTVWVTPGIPLLVPIALGLVVSFVVGDTVTLALGAAGVI